MYELQGVKCNYNFCCWCPIKADYKYFESWQLLEHSEVSKATQKNMFGSGNPTDPIFLVPTLAFLIDFSCRFFVVFLNFNVNHLFHYI